MCTHACVCINSHSKFKHTYNFFKETNPRTNIDVKSEVKTGLLGQWFLPRYNVSS